MGYLGKKKENEVAYILEFNEDQTQIRLTLISGTKVTGKDFLQALSTYIDDFLEHPEALFNDGVPLKDERH